MIEPRADMLPDVSLKTQDTVISTPVVETPVVPPAVIPPVLVVEPGNDGASKGTKTPEPNLYAALAEERRMRKELDEKMGQLEQELNTLKSTTPQGEAFSDEGKLLEGKISTLNQTIARLEEERTIEKLLVAYPVLKEAMQDFNEYRKDYPRHKMENVARLFLSEKGLLETTQRVGLETPSGSKTPVSTKMTQDDVKRLRETQPKRYAEMLRAGNIDLDF